jgi:hypothetical protein
MYCIRHSKYSKHLNKRVDRGVVNIETAFSKDNSRTEALAYKWQNVCPAQGPELNPSTTHTQKKDSSSKSKIG